MQEEKGIRVSKQALEDARKQFCLDTNMPWEEYTASPDKKVYIHKAVYQPGTTRSSVAGARLLEKSDDFFRAIMCMGQLFLQVDEQIYEWAVKEFRECSPEWFCDYDNLRKIDDKLWEYDREIMDTHIYYLPVDSGEEKSTVPLLPVQWFEQQEILQWKGNNRFGNAVCFSSTQPDMLAVAAMKQEGKWAHVIPAHTSVRDAGSQKIDGIRNRMPDVGSSQQDGSRNRMSDVGSSQQDGSRNRMSDVGSSQQDGSWNRMPDAGSSQQDGSRSRITGNTIREKDTDQSHMAGMAGISGDGEYLWQIGIDVDKEQRGWGLATNLVKLIKEEILLQGKTPFYGTSESHTISQSVALRAGFAPAWTEIYVRKAAVPNK